MCHIRSATEGEKLYRSEQLAMLVVVQREVVCSLWTPRGVGSIGYTLNPIIHMAVIGF